MKTLCLVRHAKAEKGEGLMKDIDRPLNKRGYREGYSMSAKVQEYLTGKEIYISSPSVRTLSTAGIFADESGYNRSAIISEANLLFTDAQEYLEVVSTIENTFDTALIFGHNPTISELISLLSGEGYADFPPCTVAVFELETDDWKSAGKSKARLKVLFSPQN